jgi:hypothetical protein
MAQGAQTLEETRPQIWPPLHCALVVQGPIAMSLPPSSDMGMSDPAPGCEHFVATHSKSGGQSAVVVHGVVPLSKLGEKKQPANIAASNSPAF